MFLRGGQEAVLTIGCRATTSSSARTRLGGGTKQQASPSAMVAFVTSPVSGGGDRAEGAMIVSWMLADAGLARQI